MPTLLVNQDMYLSIATVDPDLIVLVALISCMNSIFPLTFLLIIKAPSTSLGFIFSLQLYD